MSVKWRQNPVTEIPTWLWVAGGVGLGALLLSSVANAAPPIVLGNTTLMLGDTPIIMNVQRWGSSSLVFLNVHENEVTSVAAATSILAQTGGVLVRLQHGGGRFIDFTLAGHGYRLDPNRIYTDAGAAVSVEPFDMSADLSARQFAKSLIARLPIPSRGPLVALHNNTRGEGLTIHAYEPGEIYAGDTAGSPHIEPSASPDDFFLVTTEALFRALSAKGFNVVLQNNDGVVDDGSLSVYYGKRGVPS